MTALKRRDRSGVLNFVDISAPGFQKASFALEDHNMQAAIHCRDESGVVVSGMGALRRIHQELGLGLVLNWTAWPLISPLADRTYALLARFRPRKRNGACDAKKCS